MSKCRNKKHIYLFSNKSRYEDRAAYEVGGKY